MKTVLVAIGFGLIVSSGLALAETGEIPQSKCQQLASAYAKNPDSLEGERLKQLQFCINRTLTKRRTSNPPPMLKGTIVEPLSPSDSAPPAPPTGLKSVD